MTLQEIYDFLDKLSPFELQEKWDNSGLIVGDPKREVSQVVVSLDIDAKLIDEAKEGTLFVVHHPLIFGKLAQLDFTRYPANLLAMMIRKNQSLIAMHTNFDQTHLNRYVFTKVLGFEIVSEKPYLIEGVASMDYDALITHIAERLGMEYLRVTAPKAHIERVALCTGAGASLIDEVRADCFLTGDIKYHDAMKAMSQGLMTVDIGHYESERYFAEIMGEELKVLPLLVIIANSKNPFRIETRHPKG